MEAFGQRQSVYLLHNLQEVTYLIRGSITVRLPFVWLVNDYTKQVNLLLIQHKQSSRIETNKTWVSCTVILLLGKLVSNFCFILLHPLSWLSPMIQILFVIMCLLSAQISFKASSSTTVWWPLDDNHAPMDFEGNTGQLIDFINGPFPAFFLYFRFFNTADSKQMFYQKFADVWIRTSGVRSDHSTNWPTTTSQRAT